MLKTLFYLVITVGIYDCYLLKPAFVCTALLLAYVRYDDKNYHTAVHTFNDNVLFHFPGYLGKITIRMKYSLEAVIQEKVFFVFFTFYCGCFFIIMFIYG